MTAKTTKLVKIVEEDLRACRPKEGDVRKNPRRCVIHNHLVEEYPWARRVSVGTKTIRVYDYRCPHNKTGAPGGCDKCVGKRIEWATPLAHARAIKEFDAGNDPEFPPLNLNMNDAIEVPATQDKLKKRAANKKYNAEISTGERTPNKMSRRALGRAMSNRRKG